MNRLILIGNGFDLAHGMKTSVKDFFDDYFYNALNQFVQHNWYEDELMSLRFTREYLTFGNKVLDIEKEESIEKLKEFSSRDNITLLFESKLLELTYEKFSNGYKWVDLENDYFNILKANISADINDIRVYNNQFGIIKLKLIEYLRNQEIVIEGRVPSFKYVQHFTEIIDSDELIILKDYDRFEIKNIHILTFNYTNTISRYAELCQKEVPTDVNYIHGSLDLLEGEPIFGFGDEHDKDYLAFEDMHNNELFKHIKSFEYFKNTNYHELLRFIESDDFQVQIFGHSCGISDRTMLNQIFEHDNCRSIKIFYYVDDNKRNDFTEKTYEISRHFKDKVKYRNRLVPFNLSEVMPQPDMSKCKFSKRHELVASNNN